MKCNVWIYLKRYPPIACRLMARTGGRHPRVLTDDEIAKSSGLDRVMVEHLSWQTAWDTVPVALCKKFMCACNMDPTRFDQMRRANQYVSAKRLLAKVRYLRRSGEWPRFSAMLSAWRKSLR